jgi:hypothetical protein
MRPVVITGQNIQYFRRTIAIVRSCSAGLLANRAMPSNLSLPMDNFTRCVFCTLRTHWRFTFAVPRYTLSPFTTNQIVTLWGFPGRNASRLEFAYAIRSSVAPVRSNPFVASWKSASSLKIVTSLRHTHRRKSQGDVLKSLMTFTPLPQSPSAPIPHQSPPNSNFKTVRVRCWSLDGTGERQRLIGGMEIYVK